MINESIVPLPSYNEKKDQDSKDQQWVIVHTQDQSYRFRIEAIPLPERVILLLERNTAVFKAYHKDKTKVNKKVSGIEESLHSLSISNHSVTSLSCDEVQAPSDIQTTDSSRTSHVNSSNSTCDSSGGQVSQSINEDNSTIGSLESKLTSERNSSNTTAQESRSEIQNAECKAKQSVESNSETDTLKSTHSIQSLSNDTQDASLIKEMLRIKSELRVLLREEKATAALNEEDLDNIVSFGPRYSGPNVLINCVQDLHHSIWPDLSPHHPDTGDIERLDHLTSVVNGFQLATLAGPLCEEPMMGVGFKLLEWSRLDRVVNSNTFYGPISGQIMTIIKEGCRRAFQIQPQRLMAAMYTCNIQVSSEVLGKVYAVLGRRHGRIVYNDAQNSVQAYLPVLESFSFAPEIRKSTSGLASPQLVFSHWEVINIDPFWEPNTEEEYVHFGDKADTENRARTYMNSVRRRKGLPVQENLVTHGEKQRTVKKNK